MGGGKRNVTLLGLEPLTERQTEEMVTGLLASDLPAPVREALVERAGGKPFFVEELVATLIDHGLLARSNGGWKAEELGGVRDSGLRPGRARGADRPPTAGREGRAAGGVRHRSCVLPAPLEQLLGGAQPSYELLEERDFIRPPVRLVVSGRA